MVKRFVSIFFPHLTTDWFILQQPELKNLPFVLYAPMHGRMVITAVNIGAEAKGAHAGMVLADARAFIPNLQAVDGTTLQSEMLLKEFALECLRYTPAVAMNLPDGLILDVTGCTHLWGGDKQYLTDIINRFKNAGYKTKAVIADTIGAAWAVARFAARSAVIETGTHGEALLSMPPQALRLEQGTVELLKKLGLRKVSDFMTLPRSSLRNRFGQHMVLRLDQALGQADEMIVPVLPVEPYQERLPCLEPIVTARGIEIALQRLLETLCQRMQQEHKGLRTASFKGYRADGKLEEITIGTNRPSHNINHLFKLFEIKLATIEPAMGIEIFILEALKVEELSPSQEKLWEGSGGLQDNRVSELLDRLSARFGAHTINRYISTEHHWPERSMKPATSINEKATVPWLLNGPRPLQLLLEPEPIEVAAPIPDYPPMLFRYNGKVYNIKKADGPERIEREWWLEEGELRDYYCLEDDGGNRYWVFRSGHFEEDKTWKWFLYGFFA